MTILTFFSCRTPRLRLREGENEMTWSSSWRQGGRGESVIESVEGGRKQDRERGRKLRRECSKEH